MTTKHTSLMMIWILERCLTVDGASGQVRQWIAKRECLIKSLFEHIHVFDPFMSNVAYRPAGEMEITNTNSLVSDDESPSLSYRSIVYGVLSIAVLSILLYFLYSMVSSPEDQFLAGRLILAVAPHTWAAFGVASAFSFSVVGAAWYSCARVCHVLLF